MEITSERILSTLKPIIGMQLAAARRAADMRVLHFGTMRQVDGGTVGDFALHIQCPWRFEDFCGIITGRSDLWYPADEDQDWDYDTFDYDEGNLQDKMIGKIFQGYDAETGSYLNIGNDLVVENIEADDVGGVTFHLSGGYRLVLFPSGVCGEDWRFFKPKSEDEPHFVIRGGCIQ